jgi:hypothetical protein
MPVITKAFGVGNLIANLDKAKKDIYKNDDLANHGFTPCPLLQNVDVQTFIGKSVIYPIQLSGASGIGPTRALAAANSRSGQFEAWQVSDVVPNFKRDTFDWQTAQRMSGNNEGAYIDAQLSQTRQSIDEFRCQIARSMWNDGAGDLGQILVLGAPEVASADFTVTWTRREDMRKVQIGQLLDLHTQRTGVGGVKRGLAAGTSSFKVISMNLGTGTMVLRNVVTDTDVQAAALAGTERVGASGIPGQPGEFVYSKDTRDSFPRGIRAFIPDTDADVLAAGTFLGVDRTKDYTRLAGNRVTWQGTYMETIREACIAVGYNSHLAPSTVCWLSPRDFLAFLQEAEQNGAPPQANPGMTAKLGVAAVSVAASNGPMVTVASDDWLPAGRMYMLEMSGLTILAVGGKIISPISDDGLTILRLDKSEGDGYYTEYRSYIQTILTRPTACAVCILPTLS